MTREKKILNCLRCALAITAEFCFYKSNSGQPAGCPELHFHKKAATVKCRFHAKPFLSAYAPAICPVFYIFSGTVILNMVSTLKMTFFTPMHRARRACCTAESAPWMRQLP